MDLLSVDKLQLFLVFVVPGFISIKVYGLLVPDDKASLSDIIPEAVTYSMVNLGIMSWAIILLQGAYAYAHHPAIFLLGTVCVLVVSPALLAACTYKFRMSRLARGIILHPSPTAWDYYFAQRKACFVLFHLKDDGMLGGYFGKESFASAYPHNKEIYVEQTWRVDEYGRFLEAVESTDGCIISMDECRRIELFKAEEGND